MHFDQSSAKVAGCKGAAAGYGDEVGRRLSGESLLGPERPVDQIQRLDAISPIHDDAQDTRSLEADHHLHTNPAFSNRREHASQATRHEAVHVLPHHYQGEN